MFEKLGQFFKFAGKFMLYFWGCIGVIIAYHVLPAFLVIAAFVLLSVLYCLTHPEIQRWGKWE